MLRLETWAVVCLLDRRYPVPLTYRQLSPVRLRDRHCPSLQRNTLRIRLRMNPLKGQMDTLRRQSHLAASNQTSTSKGISNFTISMWMPSGQVSSIKAGTRNWITVSRGGRKVGKLEDHVQPEWNHFRSNRWPETTCLASGFGGDMRFGHVCLQTTYYLHGSTYYLHCSYLFVSHHDSEVPPDKCYACLRSGFPLGQLAEVFPS